MSNLNFERQEKEKMKSQTIEKVEQEKIQQIEYLDTQMTESGISQDVRNKFPTIGGLSAIALFVLFVGGGVKQCFTSHDKQKDISNTSKMQPLIKHNQSHLQDTFYNHNDSIPQEIKEELQAQGYSDQQIDSLWSAEE